MIVRPDTVVSVEVDVERVCLAGHSVVVGPSDTDSYFRAGL